MKDLLKKRKALKREERLNIDSQLKLITNKYAADVLAPLPVKALVALRRLNTEEAKNKLLQAIIGNQHTAEDVDQEETLRGKMFHVNNLLKEKLRKHNILTYSPGSIPVLAVNNFSENYGIIKQLLSFPMDIHSLKLSWKKDQRLVFLFSRRHNEGFRVVNLWAGNPSKYSFNEDLFGHYNTWEDIEREFFPAIAKALKEQS